jgi:hypothetical protein
MSLFQHSIRQAHPSFRIPPSSTTSIVSLLSAHTLLGRCLGVHVHHHYGYRLHLTWRATVRRTQRKRWGIERRFPTLAAIDHFCNGLMPLTDVATCIYGRWMDSFLYQKSHIFLTVPLVPHFTLTVLLRYQKTEI